LILKDHLDLEVQLVNRDHVVSLGSQDRQVNKVPQVNADLQDPLVCLVNQELEVIEGIEVGTSIIGSFF
jgi:hypothetical protein